LAFASEVLTNPPLLFCDEPTSGLDSFMAMSVVESMRSLAKQGKTIICTIHQPSSEVFELFDKLCLLAEGRLAYIGALTQAAEFFESQGFRVPYNYNPADFYIKNLAVPPANKEISLKRVNLICDGFENSELKRDVVERIDSLSNGHTTLSQEIINFDKELEYRAGFMTQMYWLVWRNCISEFRNPNALRIQMVQSIVSVYFIN
jgi:ABC-type multidrug transport system ATPase subunit